MINLDSYDAVGTVLFVDILIPGAELYLSDESFARSINGRVYQNLGSLLTVSKTHSNIRASAHNLTVTMSGLDAAVFSTAFNADVQGSQVIVRRAFTVPGSPVPITGLVQKFIGIVNNVHFKESWSPPTSEFTIAFECSSDLQLLKNKIKGRRTNDDDMKKYYPSDTSFKRVARIKNSNFNFGSPNKAPKYGVSY
jgi:hypothetical protein